MGFSKAKASALSVWHKHQCRQSIKTLESIVSRKVQISPERFLELERVRQIVYHSENTTQVAEVVTINTPTDVVQHLADNVVKCITPEECLPDDWTKVIKLVGPKSAADVVVLNIVGNELSDIEKSVIAISFASSRPTLILSKPDSPADTEACMLTGGTWPTFTDHKELVQFLKNEIPSLLCLAAAIREDVDSKVSLYKNVNKWKHGAKRAAVALVPFAVHFVNFAGLCRLVARMMRDTGMVVDTQVEKKVAGIGAPVAGKLILIEEVGDVYQYAVVGSIIAAFTAGLTEGGVAAAMETVSLIDGMLLGSVCVVTGTISAVGAYLTRPALVDSLAKFLSTLQTIYLINPNMRRAHIQLPTVAPDSPGTAMMNNTSSNREVLVS